jgi:hypothetical protein
LTAKPITDYHRSRAADLTIRHIDTIMAKSLHTRVNSIVRQSLTEALTPRGFTKRGLVYEKTLPELVWLVDLQRNRPSSLEEMSFTLNCGVFIADLTSTYADRPAPSTLKVTDSNIGARVGVLTPERLDKWWTLRSDDSLPSHDERVISEIQFHLLEYILPFLESIGTKSAALDFLEKRPLGNALVWPLNDIIRVAYCGVLYYLLKDKQRAKDRLTAAQERATGTPNEKHIRSLCSRLLGP